MQQTVTPDRPRTYLVGCDAKDDARVFSGGTYHLAIEGVQDGLLARRARRAPGQTCKTGSWPEWSICIPARDRGVAALCPGGLVEAERRASRSSRFQIRKRIPRRHLGKKPSSPAGFCGYQQFPALRIAFPPLPPALWHRAAMVPRELRNRLDVRIVGKPYMDTTAIEQFVAANRLSSCVTLRFEFVSEAEEDRLFADADAILLPYREIDASGVAMSAIARGVPILATAIDGFRELFEREGGARLVPPADAVALSNAIIDWIGAPEQLHALAEAMRLRRASIPSWDEIASLHFAVYADAHARWLADRGAKTGRHSP